MRIRQTLFSGIFAATVQAVCGCGYPQIHLPQFPDSTALPLALRCENVSTDFLHGPIIVPVEVLNLTPDVGDLPVTNIDTTFVLELYHNGAKVPKTPDGESFQAEARIVNCMADKSPENLEFSASPAYIAPFGQKVFLINLSELFFIDDFGEYTLIVRKNLNICMGEPISTAGSIVIQRTTASTQPIK